jgi:cytochrome P450
MVTTPYVPPADPAGPPPRLPVPVSTPTAAGAWPVLGHAIGLVRNPLAFLESLPPQGDVVRVRIGPMSAVVVCDPGLLRKVMLDDRTFDKGGMIYTRLREVLGNGLANCSKIEHRRQRSLVQPVFHPSRLPAYTHTVADQVAKQIDAWVEGRTLDVRREMYEITVAIVVEALFSDALTPAQTKAALDTFTDVLNGLYRRMLMPPGLDRLPTPGNRRYFNARARLREIIVTAVDGHRAAGTDKGNLLSALLAAHDDGGEGDGLSDEELYDQLVTFFVAGSDTSANLLAWALHLMARHPEVEQQVHAEVDQVLDGRQATYADLSGLTYTAQVVTETLRLCPPGWIITRTVTADTVLGGHAMTAGTTVICSPYLIHRRTDLYPDSARFDPGRWEDGLPAPFEPAFIPFGAGTRKCIGESFAMAQAVLALATIAARWSLQPASAKEVRPTRAASLGPRNLRMRPLLRDEARRSPDAGG